MVPARDTLKDIFFAAVAAVDPYRAVSRHADKIREEYRLRGFERLYVLGFGKAAAGMVQAMTDHLGEDIAGGAAVTKYGHGTGRREIGTVRLYEGGHPLPDEGGAKATSEIMRIAGGLDERSLVVFLISGGGSALLVAPYRGIALREKKETTDVLLRAGADISELNTVRKHISAVKGGRLAEMAYPAHMISLILSDVIGDRLDVIASGPTAPDYTTFSDALDVVRALKVARELPGGVLSLLGRGARGLIPETPKEGNPLFERVTNTVIGGNGQAIEAARLRCLERGIEPVVFARDVSGEAREVGTRLAREAVSLKEVHEGRLRAGEAVCVISGGETTVRVKGRGKGGRNAELALAFGVALKNVPGITLLSAGTDGTDGPTDAAGAFVDGRSIQGARLKGLDAEDYLSNNDSYTFFSKTKDLFITGPTGTNVMDLQLVLLYDRPTP